MPVSIRIDPELRGNHVHARFFMSPTGGTRALIGTLIASPDEIATLIDLLTRGISGIEAPYDVELVAPSPVQVQAMARLEKPLPQTTLEATWARIRAAADDVEDGARRIREAADARSWPRLSAGVQFAVGATMTALRHLGRLDEIRERELEGGGT